MHKEQVTPKELGGIERWVFDDKDILEVERLAAYLTVDQIAAYFRIGQATFYDIMKRQPEVSVSYQRGRVEKTTLFAQHLQDKALGITDKGDTTALIFYLKTRARWSEAVPETKIEEAITETPEEKAARMKEIKLYTEFKNDYEEFSKWKRINE